jgi:hypothetical protein
VIPIYKHQVTRLLVALLLGLAMPAATLRLATIERWCCCPDQSNCHCPDHEPTRDAQPSVGACHETQHVLTSTPVAAFTPPVVANTVAVAQVARAIVYATSEPHDAPPPRRPDAPS